MILDVCPRIIDGQSKQLRLELDQHKLPLLGILAREHDTYSCPWVEQPLVKSLLNICRCDLLIVIAKLTLIGNYNFLNSNGKYDGIIETVKKIEMK